MTDPADQNNTSSAANDGVIDAVRELISMMSKGGISELDLSTGGVTIRLRGASATQVVTTSVSSTEPSGFRTVDSEPVGQVITAPMIGTYYSAPAPGEAPFVQVGDEIEIGQVIGIIEAMKIMNEIVADYSGILAETLVENAQPVEYGSPLMRVIPTDSLG